MVGLGFFDMWIGVEYLNSLKDVGRRVEVERVVAGEVRCLGVRRRPLGPLREFRFHPLETWSVREDRLDRRHAMLGKESIERRDADQRECAALSGSLNRLRGFLSYFDQELTKNIGGSAFGPSLKP